MVENYVCRVPSFGTQQNKFFAECQTGGTRQRGRRWMPLGPYQSLPSVCLCRVSVPGTRQRQPLPSAGLCRVPYFTECGARQSRSLPSAQNLALGKDFCTRQITFSCSARTHHIWCVVCACIKKILELLYNTARCFA